MIGSEAHRGRPDRRWLSVTVAYVLLLSSCSGSTEPDALAVSRIDVSPADLAVTVGQTGAATAQVIGADGSVLADRRVFWSSQDTTIATVSQSGIITGVRPGSVQIAASSGGKFGIVDVDVNALPVSLIRVSPGVVSLVVGDTVSLQAEAVDAGGSPVASVQFAWSSLNPEIATVLNDGSLVGVSEGTTTIRATVDNVSGTTQVTVSPVPIASIDIAPASLNLAIGETKQLSATARDAAGNTLPGRQITWISAAPDVATVQDDGSVTGVALGSAVIFAAAEKVSKGVPVTVGAVPVSSVRVAPPSASINVGSSQQLTAEALDAAGNVLTGRQVSWSSSNQTIAVVTSAGLVQGVSAGSVAITANIEGKTGTSSITIGLVPVASVTLTPNPVMVVAGQSVGLTATLKDATGNVLSGRTIIWSSNDGAIASVSSNGIVTGTAAGTATITATSEGVSGTASVTVTQVPVASISVTPSSATISEGATIQLTGTAKDVQGNVLPGQTLFWQSSQPANVAVSNTGLVTGVATASAIVTASAPGAGPGGTTPNGTSTITVTLAPVASVVGNPPSATVTVGQQTPFTASLFSATNTPLSPVGRTITWRSLAPAIASVDPATGVATGVTAGTAEIEVSAASPGQSSPALDSVSVTVSVVPVASVTVTPGPSAGLFVGTAYQQTFTAEAKDANGNVLPGRQAVWTSSDPNVATVNAMSGLAVGVGVGSAIITATVAGVPGTSLVSVTLVPVSTVDVAPTSVSLNAGQSVQLTATPLDASQNPISGAALGGRTASWLSSQQTVATVSTSGLVTAVAAGSTNVTATFPGSPQSNASTITVSQGIASVAMSVAPADSIFPGGAATATATPLDAGGNPVPLGPGQSLVWATSDANVATVSSTGAISGVSPGSVDITATVVPDNVTGRQPMRVLAPIASIVVTAAADSLLPSGTTALVAVVMDAGGNPLAGRPLTWGASGSVSVNTGATGSSNIATATALPGPGTVTVAAEGKTGTQALNVLTPVTSVTVTLSRLDLQVGQTATTTLAAFDAGGNPVIGRQVAFTTSDPAVATVDPAGVVTGVAAGTAIITGAVTLDNVSGADTLFVQTQVPIASVTFNPSQLTMVQHARQGVTLTVADAGGAPLGGRLCTIASTDTRTVLVAPRGGTPVASFTAGTDGQGRIDVDVESQGKRQTVDVTATCESTMGTLTVDVQ